DEPLGSTVVGALADDAAGIVDELGAGEHPAGVGGQECIEVGHSTLAPQKRSQGAVPGSGFADNLSEIIQAVSEAVITAQAAEVQHGAVGLEEGMGIAIGGGRLTDNETLVVHGDSGAKRTTEGAEAEHRAAGIKKCDPHSVAGRI